MTSDRGGGWQEPSSLFRRLLEREVTSHAKRLGPVGSNSHERDRNALQADLNVATPDARLPRKLRTPTTRPFTIPVLTPNSYGMRALPLPMHSPVRAGHRACACCSSAAGCKCVRHAPATSRSEYHTSELQSLIRISYAVFCLKKKTQ